MISILTLFPEFFSSYIDAHPNCNIEIIDIKEYAEGSFRHIDDSPFGGGVGMVLRYDVLHKAFQSIKKENSKIVLLSPIGKELTPKIIDDFSNQAHLILVCGHYEGVDARIEEEVDEIVSVGDFILSGGESASLLLLELILRNGVE